MLSRRNKALKVSLATALSVAQIFVGLPILFSWSDASAQADPPRVWMAPIQAKSGVSGAGLLAKKLDEVSRNQLRRSNDVEMSDQGYMGPITAGDEDPRIEEAERLRSAGKEAFAAGKKEKSLEMLKAALQRYEEGLPSLQKPEVLLETLGFLGAASVDLGYEADAKDYFRRLVALAPDAGPLDEYSDAAKKYFAKVKKKLLKKKRGAIRVVTKPKGALIRVDGVEVGKSPVTVRNLVRGYHYVQAQHADAGASRFVKLSELLVDICRQPAELFPILSRLCARRRESACAHGRRCATRVRR